MVETSFQQLQGANWIISWTAEGHQTESRSFVVAAAVHFSSRLGFMERAVVRCVDSLV